MKTTLEIPDSIFRQAKAKAAEKGQTLGAFITAAVKNKLSMDETLGGEKAWMAFAGVFKDDLEESARIRERIAEGCEKVDLETWK